MEELPLQIPLKNFKQRAGSAVQKLIQHKVLFALLISFVLPALLCWVFGLFFRRIGWIKPGDLTLPQ